jgi:hypothetical protein
MTQEIQIGTAPQVRSHKMAKLVLGIVFDAIGMLSYAIPGIAEIIDIVWAPISGIVLATMYKGFVGKVAGFFEFAEEILPGTDFIPTFTLTWFYVYIIRKEK